MAETSSRSSNTMIIAMPLSRECGLRPIGRTECSSRLFILPPHSKSIVPATIAHQSYYRAYAGFHVTAGCGIGQKIYRQANGLDKCKILLSCDGSVVLGKIDASAAYGRRLTILIKEGKHREVFEGRDRGVVSIIG